MKNFLNDCTPKRMKKGKVSKKELGALIFNNQEGIVKYYINNVFKTKDAEKKGSPKQTIDAFYEVMTSDKFVEALQRNLKLQKKTKGDIFVDPGFAVIINGFIENYYRVTPEADRNSELLCAYVEIVNKLLGKKVKKISEKTGISEDIIKDLLVIAPGIDYITDPNNVNKYSQRMLRKLYTMAGSKDREVSIENTKQVKKLFAAIFGKKYMRSIVLGVLLEKKEFISGYTQKQLAVWNIMTEFAIDFLNTLDKGEIIELLREYASQRARDAKRNNDSARRINFQSLANDDRHEKINKAVKKIDSDKVLKFL